jgi:hypothetical protein
MMEQLELFPGGNYTHDPRRCLDCGLGRYSSQLNTTDGVERFAGP